MKQEVYCEIVAKEIGLLKKKIKIEVDFGDKKSLFRELIGDPLKDKKTGKTICFNSIIDALNYMSNEGWLFVSAYTLTDKDHASVLRYLMRKKVTTTAKKSKQIQDAHQTTN